MTKNQQSKPQNEHGQQNQEPKKGQNPNDPQNREQNPKHQQHQSRTIVYEFNSSGLLRSRVLGNRFYSAFGRDELQEPVSATIKLRPDRSIVDPSFELMDRFDCLSDAAEKAGAMALTLRSFRYFSHRLAQFDFEFEKADQILLAPVV